MNTLLKKLYFESLENMAEELRHNQAYREYWILYQEHAKDFRAHLSPEDIARLEKMSGYEDKMLDIMEFGAFVMGFRIGVQIREELMPEKEP